MINASILKIESELSQDEFEILLSHIPYEKQERIKKFHFFKDARNCLLGDILSRHEICRATGLTNEQLKFSTNEYGKPYLVTNPKIHFNISHSGNYIACAISNESVGIDIEQIKSFDMKIAERFFSADEITYVKSDADAVRFFEVWTKKESRIKWDGRGLSMPLSSFSVFDTGEQSQSRYYEVLKNNEVICHVCSINIVTPIVYVYDFPTLIKSKVFSNMISS
jgi:4'-phosphopantetheinyl transferase